MIIANKIKTLVRSRPDNDVILLLLAVFSAPLVLRIFLMLNLGVSPSLADFRGLLADLAVCIGVGIPIAALQRLRRFKLGRILGGLLGLLWVGFCIGNFEHVKALGTLINWDYVGFLFDGTFLKGSVAHVGHPFLYSSLVLVSAVFYVMGTRSPAIGKRWMIGLSAFALVCMVAMFLWPLHANAAEWRQRNFLSENVRWLGVTPVKIVATSQDIPGLFPADFTGKPIIPVDHPKTNVLLVVLEGISGAYLDGIAEYQELGPRRPRLPQLDKLAKDGLSYTNFFNHQRQTNRGLYAVHCGDLPKQGTYAPKMSELGLGTEELDCLPSALGKRGYKTVFIQAAPLGFMGKDKFMPRAGFEEIHGSEWFSSADEEADGMGRWGMDDLAVFQKATARIEELRQGDQPWFVSILTAGTHHPFTVPQDFKSKNEAGTFAHAVDFLDEALKHLLGYIESSGLREDTLVVFTSDESFGIEDTNGSDATMLAQAFGTLTILTPNRAKKRLVEPFAQMDVAATVLDYLGYRDGISRIGGRSALRSYDKPRTIPFANTYMRMVGAMTEDHKLVLCSEDFATCRKYATPKDRLFDPGRVLEDPAFEDVDFIKVLDGRSLYTGENSGGGHWQLIDLNKEVLAKEIEAGERIDIFANQYLPVRPGQAIDVDIEFQIEGAKETSLKVRQGLYAMPKEEMPTGMDYLSFQTSAEEREKAGIKGDSTLGMRPRFLKGLKKLHRVTKAMTPGQVFRIKYTYGVDEELERLSCALFLWFNEGKDPVTLRFQKASLDIRPMTKKDKVGRKIKLFEWGDPADLQTK